MGRELAAMTLVASNVPDAFSLTCLSDQARDYAHQFKADSTLRANRFEWADFIASCGWRRRAVLPARTLDGT